MGIGAIPAAVWRWRCATSATSASTPRCSPMGSSTSSSAERVTGARKEINRGKIVTAFLMGSRAPLRLRRRQPDGRDAPGRLHQRHLGDPALPAHGGHQLRHRDRPHRPGVRRFDRHALLLAASAARWTSCAAPRWRRRGAPSSRCPPPRPAARSRRSCAVLPEGAGVVTTRAHVRTVVTEYGVAELYGRSIARAGARADRHRPSRLPRRAPATLPCGATTSTLRPVSPRVSRRRPHL